MTEPPRETILGGILTALAMVAVLAAGIGLGMPLAWQVDRQLNPAEYAE